MRRLFGLLVAIAALAAPARPAFSEAADAPAKSKKAKAKLPPYRLIRVLPETHQALLLDKKRGKHVVVDVGEEVGGYEVTEIDEEHVVLSRGGDLREYVLVAGEAKPTERLDVSSPRDGHGLYSIGWHAERLTFISTVER